MIEVEIVYSGAEDHRRRIEIRIAEVPGLVLPDWQKVMDLDYHPWNRNHLVIDTANKSIEGSVHQAVQRMSFAMLGAVLMLSACGSAAPELGRDLPRSWSDQTPYFGDRIKQRFPIGSDEVKLTEELRKEGFDIRQNDGNTPAWLEHIATYEPSEISACRERWAVTWDDVQGKIARIEGSYQQVCL